ncbi:hypothetical protein NLJ89_g11406 [Agrocybe chaxingu]|uniref:Uncharacterized protein n=1 Tax=Agrocybe chaxingu TaxID=84603 RepID=A0A9W8JPF9_9AGAR|nr:hypothetical protein NLJ89_g11406 [Agrocybe chaxingu]
MQFYPGPQVLSTASTPPALPFPDGRLGLNDWSLHPQHFSPRLPWLGFCRRQPYPVKKWDSVDPEFVPLNLVFHPTVSNPYLGCLYKPYLDALCNRAKHLGCAVNSYSLQFRISKEQRPNLSRILDPSSRPQFPDPAVLEELCQGVQWFWEDLVPIFTAVQRGIKEMEAWLTMVEFLPRRFDPRAPIPQINRDFIGVYLNGVNPKDGAWLLDIWVLPIHVVHRFIKGVDFPAHPSDRREDYRFIAHATVYQNYCIPEDPVNFPLVNPYLSIFQRYNGPQNYLPVSNSQLQSRFFSSPSMEDHYRSAPWCRPPPAQHCHQSLGKRKRPSVSRDNVHGHTSAPSVLWSVPDESENQPRTTFDSDSSLSRPLPSTPPAPKASESISAMRPNVGKLLVENSISFWVPPPVVHGPGGPTNHGAVETWFHFYETNIDDVDFNTERYSLNADFGAEETVMVLKSRKKHQSTYSGGYKHHTYWDRHNGRQLFFLRPLDTQNNANYDIQKFGFPLPKKKYIRLDNGKPAVLNTSTWAYSDRHPDSLTSLGSCPTIEECRMKKREESLPPYVEDGLNDPDAAEDLLHEIAATAEMETTSLSSLSSSLTEDAVKRIPSLPELPGATDPSGLLDVGSPCYSMPNNVEVKQACSAAVFVEMDPEPEMTPASGASDIATISENEIDVTGVQDTAMPNEVHIAGPDKTPKQLQMDSKAPSNIRIINPNDVVIGSPYVYMTCTLQDISSLVVQINKASQQNCILPLILSIDQDCLLPPASTKRGYLLQFPNMIDAARTCNAILKGSCQETAFQYQFISETGALLIVSS